jgi:hypothetical protein
LIEEQSLGHISMEASLDAPTVAAATVPAAAAAVEEAVPEEPRTLERPNGKMVLPKRQKQYLHPGVSEECMEAMAPRLACY